MKTVAIIESFTGYPNGKDSRSFTVGEEPELSDAFADLIIGKGHAREVKKAAAKAKENDA